mmetsp:Transcript_24858/g.58327  ORF Transcript_24858/g.58327 Transcript_24858/m.58327 type:complete len:952 (+) Transcript_24858:122-2977(+)
MWGDLAGRLGATDINATLEKIGNAVAPREDDEDQYDGEDGSDGSYDDDEYEEAEDEDFDIIDGEGIINKVAGASPFRLAGILTRALDDRHSKKENSEDTDVDFHTNEKNARSKNLFSRDLVIEQNDRGNHFNQEKAEQIGGTLQRKNNQTPPGQNQLPNMQLKQNYGEHKLNPAENKDKRSVETFSDGVVNSSRVEAVTPEFQKQEEQVIEQTSLNKTAASVSKATSSTTEKAKRQVRKMKTTGVASCMNNLKDGHENDREKNKPSSQHPLDSEECHQITPESLLKADISTIEQTKQNYEEEKILSQNDDLKAACDPRSTLKTHVKESVAANEELQQGLVRITDSLEDTKNGISKASKQKLKQLKKKESPMSEKKPKESSRLSVLSKSEKMIQREDNNGSIEKLTKTPSRKLKESMEVSSQSISTSADESPLRNPLNETHVDQPNGIEDSKQKLFYDESNFRSLQNELEVAREEIEVLKTQALSDQEKVKAEREDLIAQFHSKEARLLQATSEENQNQTELLQQEYSAKIERLEHILVEERKQSKEEQEEYKRLLRESYSNVDQMESKLRTSVIKYENEMKQMQQREERALRKVDDRMAQTMAVLDERDEEIKCLKNHIREMESKVNEHQEGEEEAEEELEEVHEENDSLRQTIEKLKNENKRLKDQVSTLKSGSEELSALQMELTMLKEERNREKSKNQAVMDSAMSSHSQVEKERDHALSELKDSKQQLGATLGDLEIARSDYARIITANENLQSALEAFQDERQAEINIINEQRNESEEALKSAHATATSALKQIHETEMYEIQKASDNAVKNVMHEMELVENNLKKLKSENNQMRRALDEAIHRLQTSQEDVIDRNVMKNILLDWCILNDKSKRHQVLQVMANLLHFSDEEREKVHLTSKSLDSVRVKVVEALAAPLPPSKADVEHLEGSNVHEKWVNFLMAETDDA